MAVAAGAERRTEENLMGALLILHEGAVRLRTIRRVAAAAGPAGYRVRTEFRSPGRQSAYAFTLLPFSFHLLTPRNQVSK